MSDKLIAGLVAAAAVVPLCGLCIIGPVTLGSAFAGAVAWVGGLAPLAMALAAVGVAALAYGLLRRRRRARAVRPVPAIGEAGARTSESSLPETGPRTRRSATPQQRLWRSR